jgi:hypothetical protein
MGGDAIAGVLCYDQRIGGYLASHSGGDLPKLALLVKGLRLVVRLIARESIGARPEGWSFGSEGKVR